MLMIFRPCPKVAHLGMIGWRRSIAIMNVGASPGLCACFVISPQPRAFSNDFWAMCRVSVERQTYCTLLRESKRCLADTMTYLRCSNGSRLCVIVPRLEMRNRYCGWKAIRIVSGSRPCMPAKVCSFLWFSCHSPGVEVYAHLGASNLFSMVWGNPTRQQ